MYKRIIIIGSGGSGKSTLAKELAAGLELPVVHLDRLYWLPGYQTVDKADFDHRLLEELSKSEWIIDGNFNRTLPKRLLYCDTVIYLDYPRLISTYGVIKRFFMYRNSNREDMGQGCPERLNLEFLKWVWTFNHRYRPNYMALLSTCKDQKVFIVKNRRETRQLVETLKEDLQA